jgi:RPA family protein
MDQEKIQRQIAYKTELKDLHLNPLIKQEGWLPNYIECCGQKVSRVNVMGAVISPVSEEQNHIIIDDGSANMIVRKFDSQDIDLNKYKIGAVVNVIGKVREFNDEKYIMPEIINTVDCRWAEARKKEISCLYKSRFYQQSVPAKEIKQQSGIVEEDIGPSNNADRLIKKIKELDDGDGAEVNDILNELGQDYGRVIQNLLEQGDIFNTRPGKVKVLE